MPGASCCTVCKGLNEYVTYIFFVAISCRERQPLEITTQIYTCEPVVMFPLPVVLLYQHAKLKNAHVEAGAFQNSARIYPSEYVVQINHAY